MDEHPNLEMLRRLLTGFATGDRKVIESVATADVVFHMAGCSPFAGAYRGIDAILDALRRFNKAAEGTLKVRVHDMLANDQHGVLLLREHAFRKGKELEFEMTDIYHFRHGLIAEIWSCPHDQAAFDEFFS